MKGFLKNWWNGLRFEPTDPRYLAGGEIRIAALGGGTGLATLLRGLKQYSNNISAIVTVTDNGSSSGELRKEFDVLAPGDIRQCIAALALNEKLVTDLFNYRFDKEKKMFGGHTLGNIWITALTEYFKSFEKAIEVTSEIFQTAGQVLPSTLSDVDLVIEYEDGTKLTGEHNLDEVTKQPKKVSLTKPNSPAYGKSVEALSSADLIVIGPGSLYGSLIPNLLFKEIREAISTNRKAIKVYVMNCSTERTQTPGYGVEEHVKALVNHGGDNLIDYCLVNSNVVQQSKKTLELGEINNITTDEAEILGAKIILDDVISADNPLFHDSDKLAKSLIEIYNNNK